MRFGSSKPAPPTDTPRTRLSSGLDQFFSSFAAGEQESILDLSGASQTNIMFITGLGHRLSTEDMVGTMIECFGQDFLDGQQSAANSQRFLDQTLRFPDASFGGALVWDALQFFASPLLEQVIGELLRVMKPSAPLLVFFNADERATRIPMYTYRIQDQKNLVQVPRGASQKGQFFPNRTVEKLFERASSLKFFLTRDSLREVIVRR
jgi:hypothetical protein